MTSGLHVHVASFSGNADANRLYRCKATLKIFVVETNMSSLLTDELTSSHEPAINKHRVTHSDFDKGLRVHSSLGNLARLFKIDLQRHVGLYLSCL